MKSSVLESKSETAKIVDERGRIRHQAQRMARGVETKFPEIFSKLTRKDREVLITEIEGLLMTAMYATLSIASTLSTREVRHLKKCLVLTPIPRHDDHESIA